MCTAQVCTAQVCAATLLVLCCGLNPDLCARESQPHSQGALLKVLVLGRLGDVPRIPLFPSLPYPL